ncbi:hypothetical protein N9L49_02960 [Rhodospirillales bacterium]|nr:hypothetical protein [Rhodospirillales bacterium]
MSKNVTSIISETIGAALGTGFGIAIAGYVIFTLITDSLAALF